MNTAHRVLRMPRPVTDFSPPRVVIVAPHMDDEVIGVGGTLCRHLEAGARVTTVFLTDGAAGRPVDADPDVRHAEARKVAGFLGTDEPRFLDAPDAALVADGGLIDALAAVLDELDPQVLYVPYVGDAHRDHVVANQVVAGCAARVDVDPTGCVVRSYEVWSPLAADVAVDISDQVNRKLLALQEYRSQFVAHDPALLIGLNRYRSMSLPGARYVECFTEHGWSSYVDCVERQFADGLAGWTRR